MKAPVAIDLFSGCGGMSTGLLDAGIAVKAGFDFEARCITAYDYNHLYRGAAGIEADLSALSGDEVLERANLEHVDLIAGGPPCQSFSIVGKRRGLTDPRGHLLFDFVRLVGEIRPTAFIVENVPNLARADGGRIFSDLLVEFEDHGYGVTHAELYAPDYGVPQMRKRIFVIGVFQAAPPPFPPPPTHCAGEPTLFDSDLPIAPNSRDAIGDLPDVWDPQAEEIPNHEPTLHSPKMIKAFEALEPGQRDRKSFHDRLDPLRPSFTLRAGNGNFSPLRPVHYDYPRVVSVRESARIQGFDDSFIWPDTIPRLQQYRQVGNAVPPPMAREVANILGRHLAWSLTPERFVGLPTSRPPHAKRTMRERLAARRRRIRGASLGDRKG